MNDEDFIPLVGDAQEPMGDLWSRLEERYQAYWDIVSRGQPMPAQTPVIPPVCPPPRRPPSMNCPPPAGIPKDVWDAIADRIFPALYETLQTYKKELECGQYFIKSPNWIEPPITATRVDRKNSVPVFPGHVSTVVSVKAPDLTVGVIWAICNDLDSAAAFATTQWRELRNGAIMVDGQYNIQKCALNNVARDREPVPIILPPNSLFELQLANLGVAPVTAFARVTGALIPVKDITTDGEYSQFHTM